MSAVASREHVLSQHVAGPACRLCRAAVLSRSERGLCPERFRHAAVDLVPETDRRVMWVGFEASNPLVELWPSLMLDVAFALEKCPKAVDRALRFPVCAEEQRPTVNIAR